MGLTSDRKREWIPVKISERGSSVLRGCGRGPSDVGQGLTPGALGVTGRGALIGWWINISLTKTENLEGSGF